ncbi:hypothetical protein MHBO_000132 [Bonamia ostreae]|uniref:Uncharacterized protein n=1 Tax=Bonamia ostreae TaxID=126728 RepID=A0ABV2AEJ7_9EUKA
MRFQGFVVKGFQRGRKMGILTGSVYHSISKHRSQLVGQSSAGLVREWRLRRMGKGGKRHCTQSDDLDRI